jgi:hypothetical protein
VNIEYDRRLCGRLRKAATRKIIKAVVGGRGFNFQNVSFGTASCRRSCRLASAGGAFEQRRLTYIIRRESIEITTVSAARAELVTRVYPVADLVYPILDNGQTIPINPLTFNSQAIFAASGSRGTSAAASASGRRLQLQAAAQLPGRRLQLQGGGFNFQGASAASTAVSSPRRRRQIAGGFLQWPMLEQIIKQTIGLPSDWAGNIALNPR